VALVKIKATFYVAFFVFVFILSLGWSV